MKFLKLRIAWSAFFGLLCVLLVALWMRSSLQMDTASVARHVDVYSLSGRIVTVSGNREVVFNREELDRFIAFGDPWFSYFRGPGYHGLIVPHWFPMMLVSFAGLVAIYPVIRRLDWQFSLRALFVATTLAAMVMGTVVWSAGWVGRK